MQSEHYAPLLDLAARLWRIDPEYWDIWGRKHITSDETKRAILQGWACTPRMTKACAPPSKRAAAASGPAWRLRAWWPPKALPSICRCICPRSPAARRRTSRSAKRPVSVHSLKFSLGSYPECGAADLEGRRFVRKQVPLPVGLPLGYHDAHVRLGDLRQTTRLIVAPKRAYAHPALADGGKAAGIALALYGIRSARNWGCGDLRDLHGVVDWIADDAKASFIALNPLHAIYNRRPYNTSPYLPECIFYPNYLYLDVESIPDFRGSRRAQRLWSQPETPRQLAATARFRVCGI